MEKQGLRELLVCAVLDEAFRDRVLAEPEAAGAEFGLSEDELAALREGSMLTLRADAAPEADPAPAPEESEKGPPPLTVRLLLRVMQSIDEVEGGQGRLHFTAALHPITADADAAAMPSPEVDAGVLQGQRLDDILLDIRVMPHVARDAEGKLGVSFRHAVLPVARSAPLGPGPAAAVASGIAGRAEAVREAAPEARYAALLDLVGALSEEAGDG